MTFNDHFNRQVNSENFALLPEDLCTEVLSDFQIMSDLDIHSDEDQNIFFLVRNYVPELSHLIFNIKLNDNVAKAIAAEVFRNKEKTSLGTLLGLIEAIDLALKKMIPGFIRPKLAYPQPGTIDELPKYDIRRWVAATREIYGLMNSGNDELAARQAVIGNWEPKEQMDYEQWLKFYKERTPEKYQKLASFVDGNDGLFLAGFPIGVNSLSARHTSGRFPNPIESIKEPPGLPQVDVNLARDKIEVQRKKLISRLNSAEKMLASMDGQLFAGDDQELMLKLLQDLKRRIQTANKLTVKSSLFEDQIFRAANILKARGMDSAAGFFVKLAQLTPIPGLEMSGLTPDPSMAGEQIAEQPSSVDNKQETYEALKEFFDGLGRGVSDDKDTPEERKQAQKPQEVIPPMPALAVSPIPAAPSITTAFITDETIKIGAGYWQSRSKFAQEVPPTPNTPALSPPSEELQPTEVDVPTESAEHDDNTEDVINAALKGVSIDDVMNRLEMLVSIYNQREIVRQLSILDLMMDRLGLASFFPALGEAMGKALESNQYIGSRLEGVLTKLKGSMKVPGTSDWVEPKETPMSPEIIGLRDNLQRKQDEETMRKELRKQQDIAKLQGGGVGSDVGPAAIPVAETAEFQKPVSRIERAPKIDIR